MTTTLEKMRHTGMHAIGVRPVVSRPERLIAPASVLVGPSVVAGTCSTTPNLRTKRR
jgi:hypothetical protein